MLFRAQEERVGWSRMCGSCAAKVSMLKLGAGKSGLDILNCALWHHSQKAIELSSTFGLLSCP